MKIKKDSSNNSISSCSANNEEKSDSILSSEEEDVDSKVVSASDEAYVNNIATEVKNNIAQGSMPEFNKKPFCNTFNMPVGNDETVDNMLNELIEEKKKGKMNFLLAIRNATRGHKTTS